jgi:hypothetical protein
VLLKRIKKNAVLLICLAIMGLTILPFMGCGGSGGGGSSSNNPAPAPADINASKTQIALGDVVVDSFSEGRLRSKIPDLQILLPVKRSGKSFLNCSAF